MSDEYQSIPVADARAAVQASGLLEAVEGPQYLSPQSPDWRPYFKPDGDAEHPDFGRVFITRQGQKPREVVIPWDEYATELKLNDPKWHETRSQKPMAVFGAEVERHAYRVVFADVLATLEMPRRIAADANGITPPEPWAATQSPITRGEADEVAAAGWDLPARDWFAEVKAADAATLNALTDEARDAGALAKVEGLQQAFMDRLLELEQAKRPKPMPKMAPPRQSQGGKRRRRPRAPGEHVAA